MKKRFLSHCVFPVTENVQEMIDSGATLDNPFILDLYGMICTNYRYFMKTTKPTKNILEPVINKLKGVYGKSIPFDTVLFQIFK